MPCTLRNAKSGQYGGSRNFYMVTRGAPKGAARPWISWITHSAAAASIVGTDWVPLQVVRLGKRPQGATQGTARTGAPSWCSVRFPPRCWC